MQCNEVAGGPMSSETAAQLAEHALAMAASLGLEVAVAVVDDACQLLAFQRHRQAFPAAIELAQAKARTAAAFRRSTQAMQKSLEQGRMSYLSMPGAVTLAGGVPLRSGKVFVGAIGICGASSSQDAHIALAVARQAGFTEASDA